MQAAPSRIAFPPDEHETEALGPRPKLLDQVRQSIRARHYSNRTERTYAEWIKRLIFFHNKRHPATMGESEINQFVTDLAINKKVSASTQNQALTRSCSYISTC
jgi:hypothetical protein